MDATSRTAPIDATRARREARWYAPLVLAGAITFALLVILLAAAEVVLNDAVLESPTTWRASLARVEAAADRGDPAEARRLWPSARAAAMHSRDWGAMAALGDLALRLDAPGGGGRDAQARAREAYLASLLHARRRGSLEGVLRAAEAFAALGDVEVVEHAVRIADTLAAADPEGRARVRNFADRWRGRALEAERLTSP
jgi:hypothetical protein